VGVVVGVSVGVGVIVEVAVEVGVSIGIGVLVAVGTAVNVDGLMVGEGMGVAVAGITAVAVDIIDVTTICCLAWLAFASANIVWVQPVKTTSEMKIKHRYCFFIVGLPVIIRLP
jgi:hypothetical protein